MGEQERRVNNQGQRELGRKVSVVGSVYRVFH